jgi:hypothetical protein
MALQGKYNFKGIELTEAYIKVDSVHYGASHEQSEVIKTAAKYNEDGSIKSEAVTETQWNETSPAGWSAKVYKDKATRDSNPNNWITSINGSYQLLKTASAKNPVTQSYVAIKAMDDYKDYTDV